jgi:HAE1 family hydrophobic/amphiphilic exporter-1
MTDRTDVARARNAVSNATTNVEFFANQRLPDVRLETSYRGSGLGGAQLLRTGAFPGVVTGTVTSGFGGVLGQAFGPDYPAWSLGLTVNYPVGRSFDQVRHVQAEVERRQATARVASVQLDAAVSIRQSTRQVRSAAEREDAARVGATLAKQRLDAEQQRYNAGLSTSFLVTQAQRDLLQAEVNLLQATLDYQSSLVNFEALQLAPALSGGGAVTLNGSVVEPVPTLNPRGVFRAGTTEVQP